MTDRVTGFSGRFLLLIASFVAAELYNMDKKKIVLSLNLQNKYLFYPCFISRLLMGVKETQDGQIR